MSNATSTIDSTALLEGGWMTTEQLAETIRIDPSTLRRWRTSRPPQGPPFVPLSPRVTVYSTLDVGQWIAQKRTVPAGEAK